MIEEEDEKFRDARSRRIKCIYEEEETIDEFDAIFDRCGIWHMMKELGIPEATPALCRYDYGMAKETNTIFTREQTLAGGGSVCDCHYKKKK